MDRQKFHDLLKRALDIIGATIATILFSPILLISAALIKLDGGPVLFIQKRVGQNDRTFGMFKLRTMVPNAHEMESHIRRSHENNGGYGVPGDYADPRVTRIGALLRLLNIDEAPQFFNVLKGDMSLVGPRPVPYEESFLYGECRNEVLSVKPGITGYWQIKRRMHTDYDDRAALDTYYVKNRNTLLDAYIIVLTPISMLTSDYNSVTKPLPPVEGIVINDRTVRQSADSASAHHETLVHSDAELSKADVQS